MSSSNVSGQATPYPRSRGCSPPGCPAGNPVGTLLVLPYGEKAPNSSYSLTKENEYVEDEEVWGF